MMKVFAMVYAVVMMILFHLPEMICYVLMNAYLKILQGIVFVLDKICGKKQTE